MTPQLMRDHPDFVSWTILLIVCVFAVSIFITWRNNRS
jgi:hypothetical protein